VSLKLKVVMTNDGDFVDVIVLLFLFTCSVFNDLVSKFEFIPFRRVIRRCGRMWKWLWLSAL